MQNAREIFKIPVILEKSHVFFKWKISENIFLLLTDLPDDYHGEGGEGDDDHHGNGHGDDDRGGGGKCDELLRAILCCIVRKYAITI